MVSFCQLKPFSDLRMQCVWDLMYLCRERQVKTKHLGKNSTQLLCCRTVFCCDFVQKFVCYPSFLFLCSGRFAPSDRSDLILVVTSKAVDAVKPSGLNSWRGNYQGKSSGSHLGDFTHPHTNTRAYTHIQTQDSWLEPFIHSDICQWGWQAVQLWRCWFSWTRWLLLKG